MLKYTTFQVCFREVPDEISLCINISNCPHNCPNCHSPELRKDIGKVLDIDEMKNLLDKNQGITCVSFMGTGKDINELNNLIKFVKECGVKTCVYSGDTQIPNEINLLYLDYIKIGPYIELLGPLDSPTTNQRMYKVIDERLINITNKYIKSIKVN